MLEVNQKRYGEYVTTSGREFDFVAVNLYLEGQIISHMKHITCLLCCMILISCNPLSRITGNIEESHYALYQQEVLFVISVEDNRVWLVNPTHSRCYYLKGKFYAEKWTAGDTLVIEENLEDFYHLKEGKDCDRWR